MRYGIIHFGDSVLLTSQTPCLELQKHCQCQLECQQQKNRMFSQKLGNIYSVMA